MSDSRRLPATTPTAADADPGAGVDAGTAAAGRVRGIDHVALPMRDAEAMVAFYRALGMDVVEQEHVVVVHAGDQLVNFHRPALWQREGFTLRAPAATPPCGDLCFVWDGSPEALRARLRAAAAEVVEGPVPRRGGRRVEGSSTYVRDPDGNLVELIAYPPGAGSAAGPGRQESPGGG